jgi:hypothetical protein
MVILKNPRPVRLMDGDGRFDLKPGEEVEFETVPKDVMGLIKKGYLKEVGHQKPADKVRATTQEPDKGKVEKSDTTVGPPAVDKGKVVSSQKETAVKPKPKTKGK